MQTSHRVTRADVAREAGVSTAVVSYVVNGGPRPVAAETATRVREAMASLGYQPDLTARALTRGSSQTLGLILMDALNPFFAELHQELERAATARGFHLIVGESHGDAQVEQDLITELIGRRVDGLLLMSSGNAGATSPCRTPAPPSRSTWTPRGLWPAGTRSDLTPRPGRATPSPTSPSTAPPASAW